MGSYSFAKREDAEALLALIGKEGRPDASQREVGQTPLTHGWLFKTPAAGIAARTGDVCASAQCTPYYIAADGTLTELLDENDASQTVEVYHFGETEAVPGEAYIQAKESFGVLIADCVDAC